MGSQIHRYRLMAEDSDKLQCVIYGGIFLPPTCKINYVNMQENYVNMQVTNVLGESDFNMGKITCI
jgi:hypothetical protein